jgi:hypothetical protein
LDMHSADRGDARLLLHARICGRTGIHAVLIAACGSSPFALRDATVVGHSACSVGVPPTVFVGGTPTRRPKCTDATGLLPGQIAAAKIDDKLKDTPHSYPAEEQPSTFTGFASGCERRDTTAARNSLHSRASHLRAVSSRKDTLCRRLQ